MIKNDRMLSVKLPSNLLRKIDRKVADLRTNRSAFIRRLVIRFFRDDVLSSAANRQPPKTPPEAATR